MTMRNPNRTTKRQRRAIRRYNPYAVRVLGLAEAARWHREGILLDEARGFDNILNDLKHGPVPLDLDARVTAALDRQRHALEARLGIGPGMLTPTSSNVNNYSVHERKLDLTAAVNARLNGYGVNNAEVEVEPLGPSECGHCEVVEMPADVHNLAPGEWQATVDATRRAPATVTIPDSFGGGTFEVPNRNGARQADATFGALYQAYREARERADAYLEWNGDPWHDPNEVAAVHAEAIENALNDDIDPGE